MNHLPTRLLATAGVLLATALTACGGDTSDEPTTAAADSPATTTAAAAPEPVALHITSPDDGHRTTRKRLVVRGVATPGATVTVTDGDADDHEATVSSAGDWHASVPLGRGTQPLDVTASMVGRQEAEQVVDVTRRRTQAEIAAARAARQRKLAAARAARERKLAAARARRAQKVANYKASAATIPYKQLEKNADGYSGKRVKFTGKIFQIQEDESGGGIMLISVTDQGYGIWDDNVWVDYEGTVKGAEDDVVTVYGTITGSKSYETQVGGETYVPQMRARYVDE